MQAEESPPQLQTAAHALIHSLSRIETDSDISHISRLSALECEIRPEAFASQQIATACATLLSKASSTESLRWISSLICSATFRSTAARELFAVAELRDALCVSLLTVKNCDEVRFMCSAICSLTTQCTQGQRLFGDQTVIDCLCNAATHITTDADADASRWWCSAVCNITWMHRDNEERFGSSKPLLVSIAGVGSTITTTPAAYWWLSAIASVCRQSDVTRALVSRTAVVSEQMLCTIVNWAAMSSEGIRAAGDALSFLSACEVFRRRFSTSTVLRTAWCTMASHPQYGSSPEVVESCCRALCNLVIGPMERKQHYGTFEVRDALSNLAPGATSANSAIFFCAAVAHYCSACATLSYCLTERIENSLVLISMSLSSTLRFDARLEVCKWWCSIVAELSQTPWWTTTHASTYLPPLIQVVHSCFQEHTIEQTYIERTEVIVRSWSKCVSTMVGILHDKCSMIDEVLLVRLRSAIASIAHHVTTDETIVTLCCMIHSVSSETVAGTVLADSTMRSAFVALATRARSPVTIRWLCSSISAITIVDDAFQEFWGFDEGYALMMHMGQCMIECYDDQHDGVEEALISWATLICNITANHSMNTKRLLTFSVCNRSEGSMSSPCPRSFPDLVCELGTMCSSTRSVLWISGVVCNLSQYPQDDLCRYVWVLNKSRVPLTVHAMGRAIINEPDRTTTSYVDGVLWFAHALAHVTAQPEVQRVCCQMETCLNTIVAVTNALPLDERVVTALCGALCNLSNRLASNQIALACHPNMYSATIRLIGAIQEASSAVWWMRLILLLVPKARQPTPWFHDDQGRRCLIQLVEGNLVVGSVAIETFGMLLTFVVNSVARCAPDTMQNALLPCCETLLQRVARRLDANVDPAAHEWIHRAHKAVSNQPQPHPPPIGPTDTESILNLPSPVVVISRGQRKVSFESNVEAYARFRRLTSR